MYFIVGSLQYVSVDCYHDAVRRRRTLEYGAPEEICIKIPVSFALYKTRHVLTLHGGLQCLSVW